MDILKLDVVVAAKEWSMFQPHSKSLKRTASSEQTKAVPYLIYKP